MEKITYAPLIAHLKEQEGFYNELYKSHEIRKGSIESSTLTEWIVAVAEPIVSEVDNWNPGHLPKVFSALFTMILNVHTGAFTLAHAKEIKAALLLSQRVPACMAEAPSRVLKGMVSAVRSLREYQPDKVCYWIKLMEQSIPLCQSVDELLNIGRVCAWLCGMAHLRSRAKNIFDLLPIPLKQSLLNNTNTTNPFTKVFDKTWLEKKQTGFIGTMSTFTGFGGVFQRPPVVAQIGDYVFATDGKNGAALFADQFGQVVLEQGTIAPEVIIAESKNPEIPKSVIAFDDVQSVVIFKDTLFLTRASSHCVFLFNE